MGDCPPGLNARRASGVRKGHPSYANGLPSINTNEHKYMVVFVR